MACHSRETPSACDVEARRRVWGVGSRRATARLARARPRARHTALEHRNHHVSPRARSHFCWTMEATPSAVGHVMGISLAAARRHARRWQLKRARD